MNAEPVATDADDDSAPIDPATVRRLLATASITISSFRWKLRDAGHPFREPPGIDALIRDIDAVMYPMEADKRPRRPPRQPDPTPAQLEAARGLLGLCR